MQLKKSHSSIIEYHKREPSARSDKNEARKSNPIIDFVNYKAPRISSLSNKSINLTEENPFKHMHDSPYKNKHLKTRK